MTQQQLTQDIALDTKVWRLRIRVEGLEDSCVLWHFLSERQGASLLLSSSPYEQKHLVVAQSLNLQCALLQVASFALYIAILLSYFSCNPASKESPLSLGSIGNNPSTPQSWVGVGGGGKGLRTIYLPHTHLWDSISYAVVVV